MKKSEHSRTFFYRNGLSLTFLALFVITLIGQAICGWLQYNEELTDFATTPLGIFRYLGSGHFISSTFENFESEFLQMALYVLLTVKLRQLGSAESRPLYEEKKEEDFFEFKLLKHAPWPVKKGGWILKIYENSLFIAFAILFLISFSLHFFGSLTLYNHENALSGKPLVSAIEYLWRANFWFEVFQNWQSEFLSVASIVLLSIFLRQRDSPESKEVEAPHSQTGK